MFAFHRNFYFNISPLAVDTRAAFFLFPLPNSTSSNNAGLDFRHTKKIIRKMKRLKHTPSQAIHVNSLVFGDRRLSAQRLNWIYHCPSSFFSSSFISLFFFGLFPIQLIWIVCVCDAVRAAQNTVHIIIHNFCVRERERAHSKRNFDEWIQRVFEFIFKWFMFVNIYVSNTNAFILLLRQSTTTNKQCERKKWSEFQKKAATSSRYVSESYEKNLSLFAIRSSSQFAFPKFRHRHDSWHDFSEMVTPNKRDQIFKSPRLSLLSFFEDQICWVSSNLFGLIQLDLERIEFDVQIKLFDWISARCLVTDTWKELFNPTAIEIETSTKVKILVSSQIPSHLNVHCSFGSISLWLPHTLLN